MKLEFRPRAVADLAEIRDYLLAHADSAAADRVRRHLRQRFDTLKRRPSLGIVSSRSDIRILSPQKYPYRIYFTVIEKTVIVLHVRHTARDLPKLDEL